MDIAKPIERTTVGDFAVVTSRRDGDWVVAVQWFGAWHKDDGVRVTDYLVRPGGDAAEKAHDKHVVVQQGIAANPELWRLTALDALVNQERAAVSEAFRETLQATAPRDVASAQWEAGEERLRRARWLKERADEDYDRARYVEPTNEEGQRAIGLTKALMVKWRPGAGWLEDLDDSFGGHGPGVVSSRFGTGPIDRIVLVPSSVEAVGHAASGRGRDGTLYMTLPGRISLGAAKGYVNWAIDAVRDLRHEELRRANGPEWVAANVAVGDGRPEEVVLAGPAGFVDTVSPYITAPECVGDLKVSTEVPVKFGLAGASWREVARAMSERRGRPQSPVVER